VLSVADGGAGSGFSGERPYGQHAKDDSDRAQAGTPLPLPTWLAGAAHGVT
jgi:hypothetical protein